jgi:hypothetical protein
MFQRSIAIVEYTNAVPKFRLLMQCQLRCIAAVVGLHTFGSDKWYSACW